MKATVKRGSKKRLKSVKEVKGDVKKATKPRAGGKSAHYPITETLRWMADGEKLLIKWGAITSPAGKRIAGGVAKVLAMLESLNELRKM
jgi:hypothetical protein